MAKEMRKPVVGKFQAVKAGNLMYPLPAVLVSVAGRNGESNLITVAWTGIICSEPPMLSISVTPARYSYGLLLETGEFAVNLTTEPLAWAVDYCGMHSGRNTDKWADTKLTKVRARKIAAPLVGESPVCLECRVAEKRELGSHTMFIAEILAADVNEAYIDGKGKFALDEAGLLAYAHGTYYGLGERLGRFGFSLKQKNRPNNNKLNNGKPEPGNREGGRPGKRTGKGRRQSSGR